jgi:hypothetical protein
MDHKQFARVYDNKEPCGGALPKTSCRGTDQFSLPKAGEHFIEAQYGRRQFPGLLRPSFFSSRNTAEGSCKRTPSYFNNVEKREILPSSRLERRSFICDEEKS